MTRPGRAGHAPEFRSAVIRAIVTGSTVRDAAENYGVSTYTIHLWLRAAGVPGRAR